MGFVFRGWGQYFVIEASIRARGRSPSLIENRVRFQLMKISSVKRTTKFQVLTQKCLFYFFFVINFDIIGAGCHTKCTFASTYIYEMADFCCASLTNWLLWAILLLISTVSPVWEWMSHIPLLYIACVWRMKVIQFDVHNAFNWDMCETKAFSILDVRALVC